MNQSVVSFFRAFSVAVLSLSLLFAACSKNKDKAEGSEFVGSYAVEDGDDKYTLVIESKGGNKYQIKNFGGFMYVPVEANASGGKLNIPSQNFSNSNGFNVTIKGTAVLGTKSSANDLIRFEYEVSGSANYESDFEGIRK